VSPGPDDVLENHFWWRPGWRPGRAYLTWHVLPGSRIADALAPARAVVERIDHLAAVPPARLHITGPGVGFLDEVGPRADAVVRAARDQLVRVPRFEAVLGEPVVGRHGVAVPVTSGPWLDLRRQVRDAVRAAGLTPPGADDEPYWPHLSLAYATGPADRRAITAALSHARSPAGRTVIVAAVTLLALRMEPPGYDWEQVAQVELR